MGSKSKVQTETLEVKHAELPSGWEIKHFSDIALIDNNSLKSDTSEHYVFNYISLSDVDSEDFKIETTKQVFGTAPSRARRVVKKGDILMSTVRPNLQGFSFIKEEAKDLIASTGFAVITPTSCNGEYLFQYLFTDGINKQFYQLLVGSNYPAINSSDVKKLKIPLPPLKEQRAIANILSTWDTATQTTQALIAQKEQEKKWLMQNLLTGKDLVGIGRK
jgi:type I restriction enzyme S subunit